MAAAYGPTLGQQQSFANRGELVDFMRTSLGSGVMSEHRVTHPEITVEGDEASGSWYLQDRVIVAEADFTLIGAAFYRDRYRRTAAGWKISATAYDRTYEMWMSLAELKANVTPGRAINL